MNRKIPVNPAGTSCCSDQVMSGHETFTARKHCASNCWHISCDKNLGILTEKEEQEYLRRSPCSNRPLCYGTFSKAYLLP